MFLCAKRSHGIVGFWRGSRRERSLPGTIRYSFNMSARVVYCSASNEDQEVCSWAHPQLFQNWLKRKKQF